MPGGVLVPVDGSNFAEHALPRGLALCRRTGATLHVALVHVPFPPVTPRSPIAELVETRSAEQREREIAYLAELAERLATAGVTIRPVFLHGPVPESLAAYVEQNGIGVVVMTTHGRGGLQRAWLGSTADSLLRQCTAPLLLIRPGPSEAREPRPSEDHVFRRVLVALDGSEAAEQSSRAAVGLGVMRGAAVVLAHVLQPPLSDAAPYLPHTVRLARDETANREMELRSYLARVAHAEWLAAATVETQVTVDHDPARAILALATATAAELIVLGTHGRGGLRRMLMGSVADKVIRGTRQAVLVHRGAGRGGAPLTDSGGDAIVRAQRPETTPEAAPYTRSTQHCSTLTGR